MVAVVERALMTAAVEVAPKGRSTGSLHRYGLLDCRLALACMCVCWVVTMMMAQKQSHWNHS